MKSFVIAIIGHKLSMRAAERCILSGRDFGLEIEIYPAITPKDDLPKILAEEGINGSGFESKGSYDEGATGCFLSHYFLWKECMALGEKINIFEHDAVLIDHMPDCDYEHVINWGAPSYGNWERPGHIGVGPLSTQAHFPGTHAYGVTPEGARLLAGEAKKKVDAADVYMSLKRFPTLQEHYPFIAEARDTFTTIQKRIFCLTKHHYSDDFQHLPV